MRAIITYHSIDASGSVVSVHRDRFREHLDVFVERRVPVLSIAELLASKERSAVAITFDDGFVNFAEDAWPALRERGLGATLFVATEWVGRDNAWDPSDTRIPRLPLMGWDTLAELVGEGLHVGSHTRTHPRLTALGDADLVRELTDSRAELAERLGVDAGGLAYPFGDYDARVAGAARAAGYGYAVTTELRPLDEASIETGHREAGRPDAMALPRLDAFYLARPGVMEMWGTPSLQRYVTFRRAARRARSALTALGRRRATA